MDYSHEPFPDRAVPLILIQLLGCPRQVYDDAGTVRHTCAFGFVSLFFSVTGSSRLRLQ